jgi:hypothetical protein
MTADHHYPIKPEWRTAYGAALSHVTKHICSAQINADPIVSAEHQSWRWPPFEAQSYQLS